VSAELVLRGVFETSVEVSKEYYQSIIALSRLKFTQIRNTVTEKIDIESLSWYVFAGKTELCVSVRPRAACAEPLVTGRSSR
jgi:hypothetical protein